MKSLLRPWPFSTVGTAAQPSGGDSTGNRATRVVSAPFSAQRHPVTTEDQGDALMRCPGPRHQQLSQSPPPAPLANTLQEQPCPRGTGAAVASCTPPPGPATDPVPGDSRPLKILGTARKTLSCGETRSPTGGRRTAVTLGGQAHVPHAGTH